MRKRRLAARALELLDVVVPRECAGCGGVIVAPALICERCQKHLRLPPRQISRPVPLGLPVWAMGPYSDVRRHLIVSMKERGNRAVRSHVAAVYTAGIEYLRARGEIPEEIVLVPAPTRLNSARARGGDTVEQICEKVAASLPHMRTCTALKVRELAADQSDLNAGQRWENMRTAVHLTRAASQVAGTRIVLVDDVVTTGATLSASAARLRGAGGVVDGAIVLAEA